MSSQQQKQPCAPPPQLHQQQVKQPCQPPPQEPCVPKTKEPCHPKVPEPCHPKAPEPCHPKAPEPCHPKVPEPCHPKAPEPCHPKVPEPCPSTVTPVPAQLKTKQKRGERGFVQKASLLTLGAWEVLTAEPEGGTSSRATQRLLLWALPLLLSESHWSSVSTCPS
ncbi:Hypothetical predicted protein [Marmota monax]|uniref:Uncharacterized protein n=2 Tax=Marmota monax TaxID=9995 RepID=A0A5E4A7J5_MARMO|nr:hypothetical protein GHT09_019034 [Marmota monax]VTJ53170.1 Hypothetical predicted protein [Marmota monax]